MVKIRTGTLDDIVEVVQLWQEFMDEHDILVVKNNPALKDYVPKEENGKQLFKDYLIKLLKTGEGNLSLADYEGKIVGYNLAQIKDEIPVLKLKKVGHVADLYVQKDFRGQGLSTKLQDASISWFKKNKIKVISITVYPDNPHAYQIYKKWGFMDYKVEMRKKI
jgi:GNAT superfamily N-acetyltransferase